MNQILERTQEEGCVYCNPLPGGVPLNFGDSYDGDYENYMFHIGYGHDDAAKLVFRCIQVTRHGQKAWSNPIRFCPMCGKELLARDEAYNPIQLI